MKKAMLLHKHDKFLTCRYNYVVVNFLSEVIVVLFLVLGVVMYANEHETKEK